MGKPIVAAVKELWEQAILPWNLPITILLGLVVLFWMLKILTGADLDSGDGDLDVDDASAETGDLSTDLLRVVNAGAVPLTIVLSVLILVMWMASVLLNYYLNPEQDSVRSVGCFIASLAIAVIGTKVITQPLVPLMRRLKAAEDTAPVIGETGIVRSIEIDSRYGQVEVLRPHGAPAILNSRLDPDADPIPRGTPVAIVSFDRPSGIYLVRALSSPSH
ncbi:MAG: hypothetical protein V4584_14935 [Verrucomicrobiota bacterium]